MGAGAVLGIALLGSSLFGITGAESALVLGVVLPPFVAAAVARRVAVFRQARRIYPLSRAAKEALRTAGLAVATPALLLTINGLRTRNCAPFEGLAFELLGPGFGCALAACAGLAAGLVVRGRRVASATGALVVIASIAVSLAELYFTPAVFSFNHFAGYYPGTLYDELVAVRTPYLTFRALTLVWISALAALLAAVWDGHTLGPRWRTAIKARAYLAAGVLCAGMGIAGTWLGPSLGHRTTSAFMASELGDEVRGERCVAVVPKELGPRAKQDLLEDCEFRVETVEARLGVRHPRPLRAFFFRSTAEKKRLMGAGSTYIAKPWRNEVYLQLGGYPHPVLTHEVAHVVAGNIAPGPFRIAAELGGLWPNPGFIEGLAVAIAREPRDGLTPHEGARAMLELGYMPPLESLFGMGFLTGASSRSYAAAGSFLTFVMETRGVATLRRAYAAGSVRALGEPLDALEREWHAFLRSLTLPAGALDQARIRYERPSIFSRVCPHVIAHLEVERDSASTKDALAACDAILAIDPGNSSTRAARASLLAAQGDRRGAEQELVVLAGAPTPLRQHADEAIADAEWRRGDGAAALARYRALLAEPMADDARRPVEVKAWALAQGEPAARPVFDILVGDGDSATAPVVVLDRANRLREVNPSGLGSYLAARQLWNADAAKLAVPLLRESIARTLPTPTLRREAERLLGEALFRTGDLDAAEANFANEAKLAGAEHRGADLLAAQDWLARVAWKRRRR